MGNIRIHVGLREPVQAPSDMWLTALLISLPSGQRDQVIQNLGKIKEQKIGLYPAIPVPAGRILMPG